MNLLHNSIIIYMFIFIKHKHCCFYSTGPPVFIVGSGHVLAYKHTYRGQGGSGATETVLTGNKSHVSDTEFA